MASLKAWPQLEQFAARLVWGEFSATFTVVVCTIELAIYRADS